MSPLRVTHAVMPLAECTRAAVSKPLKWATVQSMLLMSGAVQSMQSMTWHGTAGDVRYTSMSSNSSVTSMTA